MRDFRTHPAVCVLGTLVLACLLGGCGGEKKPPGDAQRTPVAGYVVLRAQRVPLTLTLPARTTAFETSEVRPQVSGIIRARLFTEGALVHEGDLLYRIDPRVYQSAAGQA